MRTASLYRKYLLTLLTVILAFNSAERLALGVALQSIKNSFHLTDTDLGLLTGLAFALFYSTFGIPIGRWADRGNRTTIISLTLALWGGMVILSGLARSFAQLLIVRMGVAVGESGCIPTAYSLIGDYFGRSERPRAFSIYLLGSAFATVIGYFVAGWLNQYCGWREMLVLLGLPGIALAALSRLTMREPRLHGQGSNTLPQAALAVPSLKHVVSTLWRRRTFRHLLLLLSVNYFFAYGISQWQPAFFIRSYGLPTSELGRWFAVIYGFGGFFGTYVGGYLATRHAANNETLQLRLLAGLNVSFGAISACAYLARDYRVAFALMGLATSALALGNGPAFAVIQAVVPTRMRAVAISLIFMFANLIGLGLGPLTVGAISDALRPSMGTESLRYALVAMCPGYLWGAWHYWQASRSVMYDLNTAPEEGDTLETEDGAVMRTPREHRA